jgi:hypothetical protein
MDLMDLISQKDLELMDKIKILKSLDKLMRKSEEKV